MAGTREGGLRAAAKNKANDPMFYQRIGRIGGMNGNTGGFAARPDLAREASKKGLQVRWGKQQREDAALEAKHPWKKTMYTDLRRNWKG